ncbi:hypothetical protein EHS39_30960 [Ensifer sp. MPMI2T]|nr:hypothetical protein EHS39_30960 [Ensifer sp. MPMI2T]
MSIWLEAGLGRQPTLECATFTCARPIPVEGTDGNFRSPTATAVESRGAKGRLWRQFQTLASGGHVSGFRVAPPSSGRSAVGPN